MHYLHTLALPCSSRSCSAQLSVPRRVSAFTPVQEWPDTAGCRKGSIVATMQWNTKRHMDCW